MYWGIGSSCEAGARGGGGNAFSQGGADPRLGGERLPELDLSLGRVSPGQRQLGEEHVGAAMAEAQAGLAAQSAQRLGVGGGSLEAAGGEIQVGVEEMEL